MPKKQKKQFETPKCYVAIGASAGGLEALEGLLRYMPADSGVAIIIVQHLSPDFKSVMDELLARYTSMPVVTAVDNVQVEANSVYLIPPRKNMMIAEGKLILVDQLPDRGLNFPIDIFFRSLAEDQHHRSMAVVLSGTGSDGSRGIQAIKEVGGLVIVQEPRSAKFDGMPLNAVKTGTADVVAPPNEIPEKIIQYITHPVMNDESRSLAKNVESDEAAMHEILNLLRDRSEIDFSQYKTSTIVRRIERRLGINGLDNLQDFLKLLLKSQKEIYTLAKDMLIGVTRFFRDTEAFDVMEKKVIPEILAKTPSTEPIRVWIAGCSTGEEAYSLAILFDEAMHIRGEARSVKIFATDVDPDSIAEASTGFFSPNIAEDMSEKRIQKYFTQEDEHLTIIPAIRQMVVFATHNLIKDPPFSNTQLAVCRNVLIYFQPAAQKRILSMLHFSTKKNGFLFLGSSDSLGDLTNFFEAIHEKYRVYRKIANSRSSDGTLPLFENLKRKREEAPSIDHLVNSYQKNQSTNQFSAVKDSLIMDYAPPCIVLDEDNNILHVFGDVSPYTRKLKAGKFSSNLKDIICEGLQIAVSTAIHRATSEEANVQYDDVQFKKEDGKQVSLNLRIRYVKPSGIGSPYFIVVFADASDVDSSEKEKILTFNIDAQTQQRIHDLESQLQKKHEHLQATIEELETTNEELQASNEELMAANEELQSTNEELQSVNEELYTVNSEYQGKIEELTQVNTDIDNIIKSTDIGIVFLDDAMLIRNFSPASTEAINLLPTDIGRPFHHISHELKYDNLLADIGKVIADGEKLEKEVQTTSERILHVKISPYIDEHKLPSGCVVALNDMTAMSTLKGKLAESHQELRATIATSLYRDKQQIKVLIVDDDADDCRIIKQTLFSQEDNVVSYISDEAHTYEDAEVLLATNEYDVCLIDYNLGGKTALDLIKNIAENNSTPAFIMLSGVLNNDVTLEAISLGLYDTIDKNNITPHLISRSIRYAMRDKQTVQYLTKHSEFTAQ